MTGYTMTGRHGEGTGGVKSAALALSRPAWRWHPDLSRDAMLVLGVFTGIGQAIGVVSSPIDAVNYWRAGGSTNLYPEHWSSTDGAFLFYPPPTVQISTLLQPIGWNLFIILWTTLLFGCFWWCARRWSLPLVGLGVLVILGVPIPFGQTFLGYALLGNMQWLLAAITVLALRHPSGWAVLLWTKTGPAVGGLWHLARGEWFAVRRAAVAATLIFTVSFAFAPAMWDAWIGFVIRNADMANPPVPLFPVPFVARLAMSAAVVAFAARTDRAWLVPIGAGLALPALYGLGFLPFWLGALRLRTKEVPRPY